MTALRGLDLYCGAGLVAEGLLRAGVEVLGVDDKPQPSYPGPFLLHDALTLDPRFIAMFDFIWASPPCLRDTAMRHAPGAKGLQHPDLITPTRRLLKATGKPYVLENVETAPLIDPVILCGSHFQLGATIGGRRFHLERHRKIETNFPVPQPKCSHASPVVGVYGGHARIRAASAGGRTSKEPLAGRTHPEVMAEAMGCRVLTGAEISQGIPPAYASYIVAHLQAHLLKRRQEAA